jgi:acyl-CoA thioesterase I
MFALKRWDHPAYAGLAGAFAMRVATTVFKKYGGEKMIFVVRAVIAISAAFWLVSSLASSAAAQVVAIGDSATEGIGVGSSSAYPAQLEALLNAKGYHVSVKNAGVIGDTTAMILGRLDSVMSPGTKVVILQMGFYNDWRTGVSREQNAANVKAAMARVRSHGANYVWINDSNYAAIPRSYYGDGLHLNEQGQALLASRILPQVVRALGSRH